MDTEIGHVMETEKKRAKNNNARCHEETKIKIITQPNKLVYDGRLIRISTFITVTDSNLFN